jgi:hypothetical protein
MIKDPDGNSIALVERSAALDATLGRSALPLCAASSAMPTLPAVLKGFSAHDESSAAAPHARGLPGASAAGKWTSAPHLPIMPANPVLA